MAPQSASAGVQEGGTAVRGADILTAVEVEGVTITNRNNRNNRISQVVQRLPR